MTTFPSQLANRLAATVATTQRLVTTAHQRLNTVTSAVNALQPAVSTAQANITANTTAISTTAAAQTATAATVTTVTSQAGSTTAIGYMPTTAWWTSTPEAATGGVQASAGSGFSTTTPNGTDYTSGVINYSGTAATNHYHSIPPTGSIHWHGMNHSHDENVGGALSAQINAVSTQLNAITAKLIAAGIL